VASTVPIWLASANSTNVGRKPRLTTPPVFSHSNTKRNLNSAPVAATIYVDDGWVGTPAHSDPDSAGPATDFGVDSFATIQGAVNAASPGDTVLVYAGNYTEQVTISKNLTLTGENTATTVLHTPATLSPRIGGTFTLVQVDTSAVVNMSGLTISGPYAPTNACADPVYYGIFVVGGADLNLHDAAVTNIQLTPASLHGCQTGIAVRAGSMALGQTATLTVDNMAISGYQKSAIIVDNTGSSGTITNNTITGLGPDNIGANAIQIGRGAGATITGNNITANECTNPVCGPNPLTQTTSTGVLIFQTSAALLIDNNTISTNDTGIYNNGGNTTISGNTMVGNRYNGIFQDQGSSAITGNTLTGPMNVGFAIASFSGNTGNSTATLTGNTIVGATTGLQLIDETNADAFVPQLTAHFNRIVSGTKAIDNPSNQTANLENNWWGCNNGPGGPGCGAVTGSAVSSPWFVVAAQAVPNSMTPGGTSNVSVDLTRNSDNIVPAGTIPPTPVSYNTTNGNMTPPTGTITSGAANSQFTSTSANSANVTVTVDNQNLNLPITVTAPSFSISDETHQEGNPPGTTSYVFTVTKSGGTALSSSVNFTTQDGTATVADNDYALQSGTLTFGPTDATMQITVTVNHDFKVESDEVFTVHLSGEVGATISKADGTGTIQNDDNQPSVVYVDDDFTGPIGSDPAGPATAIGYDAFATIQEGINAVTAGGTVIVAPGTYTENLTLTKSLTIKGAKFGVDARGRVTGAPNPAIESIITSSVANTALLDMNTGAAQSIVDGFVFSGGGGGGTIGAIRTSSSPMDGVQVRNNYLTGFKDAALWYNRGGIDMTISQNVMDGASMVAGAQIIFLNNQAFPGLQILNNSIINGGTRAGLFVDGVRNVNPSVNRAPQISGNLFQSNTVGINMGSRSFDAGSITGNTFDANTFDGLQGGPRSTTISGNTFSNNGRSGLALTSFGNTVDPVRGAQNCTIVSNTFTGNGSTSSAEAILFSATQPPGTISTNQVHFNRIVGNFKGATYNGSETIHVENNWWGCNYGPGTGGGGCTGTPNALNGTGSANLVINPWVVQGASASPASITPGGTSTITADMTRNSSNAVPSVTDFVPQVSVSFSATNGTIGPSPGTITSGQAQSTFTSTNSSTGQACGTVDGQQSCTSINILLPSFSIDDVTLAEGNSGTTAFTFTISKTGAGAASIDYATANGTATAPTDYTAIPTTTLSFASGDASKQVTVQVKGDPVFEANETFTVHLSNPVDATISDADGLGTINNDDTQPTVVYVDDDFTGPTGSDPDGAGPAIAIGYDSFRTIQEGVDAVAANGTVNVYAGNYPENVTVPKSVSLLGPNAAINPNTGARVPEAVVRPAVTQTSLQGGSTSGTIFRLGTGSAHINVTLKGLTLDGNNPTLTGGRPLNGVEIHTSAAVVNSVGSFDSNPGAFDTTIVVQNNIIQNLERYGVLVDNVPARTPSAGNDVSFNKIDNLPSGNNFGGGRGRGIAFEENVYGSATFNVMTRVNVGWQDDNYNLASPGAGTLVDHNQIHTYHRGIFHNLQYQDATAATITNNQIFAETNGDSPASTTNFGVELSSIQSAVGVTVTDNSSTGNVYGILLWNLPTTNTINVSGGTLSGNQYGVLATSNDPQFGAGAASQAMVSGVNVSGATVAGVAVRDTAAATKLTVSNANVSAGTGVGMLADGAGNSMNITGSTITGCAKGVVIRNGAVGNSITGNSIHDNTGLGIDLGDDGVTPNDSIDTDSGANNLQNFPIIATALVGTPNMVSGTLNSAPGQTFTIHLYANPACDASGNGEGQTLIGSATANTNGSGDAVWSLNPGSMNAGDFITATATDAAGNTSEFSACFQARAFTPGTITFNQVSNSETNANHDVNLVVSRTGGSDGAVSVQYSVNDGAALVADNDYSVAAPTGTFTWANGDASDRFITINVKGDNKFEANETVLLSLSNPTGGVATGGTNPALTITNDDPPPAFSIDDVTHNEGDAGTTAYVFTITKTGNTALDAGVNFQTADNTATAGSDYQSQTGTLTFLPADATRTVTVLVNGDTNVESDETFSLNLSGAINATISDSQGVGTITNDDTSVSVAVSPSSVSEDGATNLVYTFTRNGITTGALTVNFTVGGTATFNSDYTQSGAASFSTTSGTVTFATGSATAAVTVDPTTDVTVESNETVILTVTSGTGYNVATPSAATGTITNDDTDVSVAVSPASVLEDGATNLVYTFTRNGNTAGALTANFTVGGTATFNSDYTQSGAATFSTTNGTVTFAAGSATATVTIDPTTDSTVETNEVVILTVTAGTGYGVGTPSTATGTILNDDGTTGGTLQFSATSYNTNEGSFFATITVQRLGDTTGAVSVDYTTPDDSAATIAVPCETIIGVASPRCDFTTAVGTLQWASGDNAPKSFIVLISEDDYVEGAETLTLTLSNPTGGATLGSSTAILTINDDLTQPTTNPIDDPSDFVRQHYHDFLNREPDPSGFAFWVGNFPPCSGDAQCIEVKRINVSAAFYLSIEFQGTGFFVERLYKSSYGDANGISNDGGPHQVAVPIVKFSEFLPDTQEIGRGVVVGADGWEAALEAKKVAFADQFVQRTRFLNAYPLSMTPAQFVDTLNASAGNPLSTAERDQLVSDLTAGAKTRAQVLRAVADDQDLVSAEFNRAFVLIQYFGYLRRNPNAAPDVDHSGYDFWLKKLNSFNGNFIAAEMVKAFLNSTEYRHRAGVN
jgi:hypothetical protein